MAEQHLQRRWLLQGSTTLGWEANTHQWRHFHRRFGSQHLDDGSANNSSGYTITISATSSTAPARLRSPWASEHAHTLRCERLFRRDHHWRGYVIIGGRPVGRRNVCGAIPTAAASFTAAARRKPWPASSLAGTSAAGSGTLTLSATNTYTGATTSVRHTAGQRLHRHERSHGGFGRDAGGTGAILGRRQSKTRHAGPRCQRHRPTDHQQQLVLAGNTLMKISKNGAC